MEFIFAKITNSRLMGSMGMVAKLKHDEDEIYRYFLLDSEGLGISDYVSLKNPTKEDAYKEEERLMGGLGSDKILITESEYKGIINYFGTKTIEWEKDLSGDYEEYIDIIEDTTNQINIYDIYDKICKPINEDIEFVNYMCMRFIAGDREALGYYCENEKIADMIITDINATLLKTEVLKKSSNNYIAKCLYEDIDGYYSCTIAISLNNRDNKYMVKSLLTSDIEGVYDFEVFDEISKPEFISIYDINHSKDYLADLIHHDNPFVLNCEMEEGALLTRFNFNNNHVKSDTYVINNDIKCIYYICEKHVYIGTYSDKDRKYINKIFSNKYGEYVTLDQELYFDDNVLYEFAESGATDFFDFLDV